MNAIGLEISQGSYSIFRIQWHHAGSSLSLIALKCPFAVSGPASPPSR
jgi:hypothetical protein